MKCSTVYYTCVVITTAYSENVCEESTCVFVSAECLYVYISINIYERRIIYCSIPYTDTKNNSVEKHIFKL